MGSIPTFGSIEVGQELPGKSLKLRTAMNACAQSVPTSSYLHSSGDRTAEF